MIVKEARSGDLAAFLARRAGRKVTSISIPGDGTGGAPEVYHLVQVDPAQYSTNDLAYLMEQFSSASGAFTLMRQP